MGQVTVSLALSKDVAAADPEVVKSNMILNGLLNKWRTAFHGPLVFIVLVAFCLRGYWAATHAPVICAEGSEYVRIGENLWHGKGYVGNFEGPELMYSPLYPVAIAGLSALIRNPEVAAHVISVVLGTCLIFPVFFIALRMYGWRAAYMGAVLVALHPVLIELSASTYNETTYLTLLMAGVYWGLRSTDFQRSTDSALAGISFGLAYLTRPEAFVYPAFFLLVLWVLAILNKRRLATAAFASVFLLAPFLLVASPYVAFLHRHTGQWRLEGKWNINYTTGTRIHSGMTSFQAEYGIAEDLQEEGPLLNIPRFAGYTPYSHTLREKFVYLWTSIGHNRQLVLGELLPSRAFGSPLLLALLPLALFRKAWRPKRLVCEFVLLAMAFSIVFLMLTNHLVLSRYAFPLLPFLLLWAAKGSIELGQWAGSSAAFLGSKLLPSPRCIRIVAKSAAGLLLLLLALSGTRYADDFQQQRGSELVVKQSGLWLKRHEPRPRRIVSIGTVVSYYCGASWVPFPAASSPATLKYIASKEPDFVVLDTAWSGASPVVAAWVTQGIPDARAQLTYEIAASDQDRKIQIYGWKKQ